MQIEERPSEQLVLMTRPNWLLLVVGVVMLLLGFVVATLPAKLTTLECQRLRSGTCEIVETSLLSRRTLVRFPVFMLHGAKATPIAMRPGSSSRFYRLHLAIDDGRGPYYFTWYGDHEQARQAADRITEFAADPHDVFLSIRSDKRPLFGSIGAALGGLGLVFLMWGAQRLTVTFDRLSQAVSIRRRSWRGQRFQTHTLESVAGFHVAGLRQDCLLFLILKDGRRVPLSASYDSDAFGGPRRVRTRRLEAARRLSEFCRLAGPESPLVDNRS